MENLKYEAQSLLGITMTQKQEAALRKYEEALMDWNTRINLTAIAEPQEIRIKHFLDSLTCSLPFKNKVPKKVIDIGTGAGFPGIPLKIFFPEIRLTLVESIGKKTKFLEHIVQILNLQDVTIIQDRAEEVGHIMEHREAYDLALARAVANLSVLVEYLLPLVKVNAYIIAQKGESAPAEAHTAEKAIHLLGGRLRQLHPITLPGVADDRYLVLIDKIAATPARYPRRVGVPSKSPL